MAEGQMYLHPQGIKLTGSFRSVRQNLKFLATCYPTLKDLRLHLQPPEKPLTILPFVRDR